MAGRNVIWRPAGGGPPLTLTDRPAGYRMLAGVTGLDAPPYEVTTEAVPGWDGEQLRSVRAEARVVRWPILIRGSTRGEFRARARHLLNLLDPAKGPGQLEITESDGQRRFLSCVYTGGLEGDSSLATSGDGTWWRAVVSWLAASPWWSDGNLRTLVFPYRSGPASTFFPILPLRLSTAQVLGATEVTNPGDVEAWPTWLLEGQSTGLTLTREDTGEFLALAGATAAGDPLRIVTEPGQQSIALLSGVNRWPNLLDGSTLWRLPAAGPDGAGVPINIAVDGAAAGTAVTLSYYPRYRTPL